MLLPVITERLEKIEVNMRPYASLWQAKLAQERQKSAGMRLLTWTIILSIAAGLGIATIIDPQWYLIH